MFQLAGFGKTQYLSMVSRFLKTYRNDAKSKRDFW